MPPVGHSSRAGLSQLALKRDVRSCTSLSCLPQNSARIPDEERVTFPVWHRGSRSPRTSITRREPRERSGCCCWQFALRPVYRPGPRLRRRIPFHRPVEAISSPKGRGMGQGFLPHPPTAFGTPNRWRGYILSVPAFATATHLFLLVVDAEETRPLAGPRRRTLMSLLDLRQNLTGVPCRGQGHSVRPRAACRVQHERACISSLQARPGTKRFPTSSSTTPCNNSGGIGRISQFGISKTQCFTDRAGKAYPYLGPSSWRRRRPALITRVAHFRSSS